MKTALGLAAIAAASLAALPAHAQGTYSVPVNPIFTATLAPPTADTGTVVFASNLTGPDAYGLGFFSLNSVGDGTVYYELENDTLVDPNGPVSLPYDVASDVTFQSLLLTETYSDKAPDTVTLYDYTSTPQTSLDTNTIFLDSNPFTLPADLTSATLSGTIDTDPLTIAAAPEPGSVVPLALGSLLLGGLVLRRRSARG